MPAGRSSDRADGIASTIIREPVTSYGCTHADGAGGATTGGRSSHVIVFGSSHGASHGPVVPPPSLLPRSVTANSEPADGKWNQPQLLIPPGPTLRESPSRNVGPPAERALSTDVPVPSTWMCAKCTFEIV